MIACPRDDASPDLHPFEAHLLEYGHARRGPDSRLAEQVRWRPGVVASVKDACARSGVGWCGWPRPVG
jgi:hypothetical protein